MEAILTYDAKYRQGGDVLNGEYLAFYQRYRREAQNTPLIIKNHVLQSSNIVPKVFLCQYSDGATPPQYLVRAIHRPTVYAPHPVRTTAWDQRTFCFRGDVMPGSFIDMIEFPAAPFNLVAEQVVPTWAQIQAILAANPNTMMIPPQVPDAADTERIRTRALVPVPPAYVHLVLSTVFTPRSLHTELGGAIMADNREVECAPLLDWIRVALTMRPSAAAAVAEAAEAIAITLPPATCMAVALPTLTVDADLQGFRWGVLCQDLLALNPTQLAPPDQMIALVGALRQERQADRAADLAQREALTAPKKPSKVFPMTYKIWMALCSVDNEAALPPIYHQWANANKHERRLVLAQLLEQRGQAPEAATRLPPIASKELFEMILQGKVAPYTHELTDLSKGISPFTCGFLTGEKGKEVQARADGYNLALAGLTAPTISEQASFTTKDVPIPDSLFLTGAMLKTTSIVLDVIQGPQHAHAVEFRRFVLHDWPAIETKLALLNDANAVGNLFPGICRHVQIDMGSYLRGILDGNPFTPIPAYQLLRDQVLKEAYYVLPTMPAQYRTAGQPGNSSSTAPAQDGRRNNNAGTTQLRSDPGPVIQNPKPNSTWTQTFAATGLRLQQVRNRAPLTQDDQGNEVAVCLSYHLKGQCWTNCARHGTHRLLNRAEAQAMGKFLNNVSAGGGPSSDGNQPTAATSANSNE